MTAIDLRSRVREVPDFPEPGIGFKDIAPLLLDPEALKQTVDALATWTAEQSDVCPVDIDVAPVPVNERHRITRLRERRLEQGRQSLIGDAIARRVKPHA